MHYALVSVAAGSGREDFFTYSIPENLQDKVQVGQIVLVPFRNKKVPGIIFSQAKKPVFKTKEVIKVITPPLPRHLLQIASWMSEYYAAPLWTATRTILPTGASKKRRPVEEQAFYRKIKKRPELTLDQRLIADEILAHRKTPHLLFGVTGSGKTEVYLEVLEKILEEGKEGLILVPEISLTPQTILRFEERFPGKVALFHSYLKETERFAVWRDVFEGRKKIVVGSRSALFLPFFKLGLIVLDEEHESSFKQDQAPRYHARRTAEEISRLTKSILIAGSATPSIDSFYKAEKGKFKLHSLQTRYRQSEMPETFVVDMRQEFKRQNYSLFSEQLQQEIQETLDRKKQVVLFINRRGHSTFISCRDCGFVLKCPRCEIPLTYHKEKSTELLFCHHCNYKQSPPNVCPACQSAAIKFYGGGTQKVEMEIKKIFPQSRVRRMDRDSVKRNHQNIYEDFKNKNFDILVGTQMITKGWDLPNVHLVGIISIDHLLNLPDYTSSERAFSLVTQVAGRTGRGENRGKVIIQTYNPDSETIKLASKYDYQGFYEKEIGNRKELLYPPFSNLILLSLENRSLSKAEELAEKMKKKIIQSLKGRDYKILGPALSFIPKIDNKYQIKIVLKIDPQESTREISENIVEYADQKWKIDVEPIGVM